MSTLNRILDSGWGALFLYLYSATVLYVLQMQSILLIQSERFIVLIAAVIPPAVVVFLATVFNDALMEVFAGEVIEETFNTIDGRTGSDEFYWDADSEIQNSIDEMDQKAHKHLVTVLSGLLIAVSLPFVSYLFLGIVGTLLSIVGAILVIYLFSYRSYRDLRQVVKSSMKLYETNNED
ncbi:hypothetical protein GRX03_12355 [Halovenus sp. WSH3]|uniref:Uncharacterized protein n=1 Tax=Halovenus carboxidivorans TaxID=2692199 RepID=A0A6B0TAI8_9EURY|nr:hypothetical protein [Halovenus carboxidivorans]MXR52392.1 hypothetical protein [Halovenus carboxidivorans]